MTQDQPDYVKLINEYLEYDPHTATKEQFTRHRELSIALRVLLSPEQFARLGVEFYNRINT